MVARWWDDAAEAAGVLSRVDDSDVAQGVGTAVLGYHALAKAALSPLVSSTLVDAQDVVDALGGVDLTPVSKALAEATRPVMGAGADVYGRLLADDLHHQAQVSARGVVSGLVAKGVSPPLAVQRAAAGVGLPADRTGRFAEAMAKPALPDIVVNDAADRALMEFAAHMGRRELVPLEGVVSKATQQQFEEAEHPRDREGKFAQKGAERKRNKRARLSQLRADQAASAAQQRQALEARSAAQRVQQARSLGELASALMPRRAEPQVLQRGEAQQRVRAGSAAVRAEKEVKQERPKLRALDQDLPHDRQSAQVDLSAAYLGKPAAAAQFNVSRDKPLVAMVSPDVAAQIVSTPGQVSAASLRKLFDGDLRVVSDDQRKMGDHSSRLAMVERAAQVFPGVAVRDLVVLEFSGSLALTDDDPNLYSPDGVELAPESRFDVEQGHAREVEVRPSGVVGRTNVHNVIRLTMSNDEVTSGLPVIDFGKAASERWDVNGLPITRQVDRDSEGQFTQKGSGVGPSAKQRKFARRRQMRAASDEAARRAAAARGVVAQRAQPLQPQRAAGPVLRRAERPMQRAERKMVSAQEAKATAQAAVAGSAKPQRASAALQAFEKLRVAKINDYVFTQLFHAYPSDAGMWKTLQSKWGADDQLLQHLDELVGFEPALPGVVNEWPSEYQLRLMPGEYTWEQASAVRASYEADEGHLFNFEVAPVSGGKWRVASTPQVELFMIADAGAEKAIKSGGQVGVKLSPATSLAELEEEYQLAPGTFGKDRPVRVVVASVDHNGPRDYVT